jgi:hypothetical protein
MKRLLLLFALPLFGCGNGSSEASKPVVTPDTGVPIVDDGPPPPPAGDPPVCEGVPSVGTPPSARHGHAGVLDPTGRKFFVFGGDTNGAKCGEVPSPNLVSDAFVLDVGCGSWKAIAATGPSARAHHVLVSDPRRDRALLFGGRASDDTRLKDLWGLDYSTETWTKLETSGAAPSPRSSAAAVYERKRDRMIIFGGAESAPLDETFALNLEFREWKVIGTAGQKPSPRVSAGIAIDSDRDKLYVFGGSDGTVLLNDLFVLDLATDTWSKVAMTGEVPRGRTQFGLSYDSGTNRLVVFGGRDDGMLGNQNDLHVFDLATSAWIRFNVGDKFNKPANAACDFPSDFTTLDVSAPERRSAFAFTPTTDGRGFILHAGKTDCGVASDVMWFNVLNETFFSITKSSSGLSCLRSSTSCSSLCE